MKNGVVKATPFFYGVDEKSRLPSDDFMSLSGDDFESGTSAASRPTLSYRAIVSATLKGRKGRGRKAFRDCDAPRFARNSNAFRTYERARRYFFKNSARRAS